MTTKKPAKSAPKPKAKAETKAKAEPKPEAPVAEVEQTEVADHAPKAAPKAEAQADQLSTQQLALLGREFRAGNQDRKSVLDAHDRYLAQAGNAPKDVEFAKNHKRVIQQLP